MIIIRQLNIKLNLFIYKYILKSCIIRQLLIPAELIKWNVSPITFQMITENLIANGLLT